jgi:thioredoxin reductase (NADPH)
MNDITIIGTGPAGLTAAIYAARAGFHPVVYAGLQPGGQLTTTSEIENFPGFEHGIQGPELMRQMTQQAERVGARVVYQTITRSDVSRVPYRLWTDENQEIQTRALIIATGATAKTLGLPHESELMGKGISTCATCDGFFYRKKQVVVIGGGDSAMEEALYLGKLCSQVTVVHRSFQFKASKVMIERARQHPNLRFMQPYQAVAPLFDAHGVTGLRVRHQDTGAEEDLACHGIFYAIGHTPNSKPFQADLATDALGYIKTTHFTATSVPGVFAAGDIADPHFRQAITAAGMGCQAAMQAAKFLEEHDKV